MSSQEHSTPREFGEALKSARAAAGVSAETIIERLKITRRTLDAFEAGEFGKLPSLSFARMFLRQIVALLGEDPQRWTTALDRAWERWLQGSQVIRVSEVAPTRRRHVGPWLIGLLLVAGGVAGVLILAGKAHRGGDAFPPPTPAALLPLLAPTPSPVPLIEPQPEAVPAAAGEMLVIRTGPARCWVQVRIAGDGVRSRLMEGSALWEIAAGGKPVELVLGDAGAIQSIEYLGQIRTELGRSGEVARLVLSGSVIPEGESTP